MKVFYSFTTFITLLYAIAPSLSTCANLKYTTLFFSVTKSSGTFLQEAIVMQQPANKTMLPTNKDFLWAGLKTKLITKSRVMKDIPDKASTSVFSIRTE